jgi:hypothetical protein
MQALPHDTMNESTSQRWIIPTTGKDPEDRRPKKKKKQDYSKILCYNCKELGHFADQCPERNSKSNTQGSVKRDLSTVTCYKCKQKGADKCTEKST